MSLHLLELGQRDQQAEERRVCPHQIVLPGEALALLNRAAHRRAESLQANRLDRVTLDVGSRVRPPSSQLRHHQPSRAGSHTGRLRTPLRESDVVVPLARRPSGRVAS